MGLCRLLTSARTFPEALALAAAGDAGRVDVLVGDIYGAEVCESLKLSPALTASLFGKLGRNLGPVGKAPRECDLARSVLHMVAQSSALLVKAIASEEERNRVFFVGGFLESNLIAQRVLARSVQQLGGRALFLRHGDFLGALGSLAHCLHLRDDGSVQSPRREPADAAENIDSGQERMIADAMRRKLDSSPGRLNARDLRQVQSGPELTTMLGGRGESLP